MTNIKLVILSIATVLGLHSTTFAELSDPNSYIRPNIKVSIFGHTGQDPVAKSYGGSYEYYVPPKTSLKIDIDVIKHNQNTFINYLMIKNESTTTFTTLSSDFSNGFTPAMELLPEQILDDPELESNFYGGTVPAPPAFLLLMSGALFRPRRKP